MKAARVAHNLEYLMGALDRDGINCSEVQGDIEDAKLPFWVKLDCYADVGEIVAVNLKSCSYIYGFRTVDCDCDADCVGRDCGSDGCGGSCGPGCEHDEVCVNGQCVAPVSENGVCGTAAHSNYAHDGLEITLTANLCSSGRNPVSNPVLPSGASASVTWTCSGIGPGSFDSPQCTAQREAAPAPATCGEPGFLPLPNGCNYGHTDCPGPLVCKNDCTCVECISNTHCTGTNQVCNANNQCVCRSDFSDCNNDGNCDCNTGAGNQCRNGECCIRVKGTGSFNANPPERGTGLTFEFAMVGGDRYLVRNDQNSINQRCKEVTVGSRDYVKGYFISASTWCGSYSNACYKHWTGTTWQSVCCRANPGPEVVGWAWCCK
jgi:hypothetical protein